MSKHICNYDNTCCNPPKGVEAMSDQAGSKGISGAEFRKQWSHKPTPIPLGEVSGALWYSEECVDQMLEEYALRRLALVSQPEPQKNWPRCAECKTPICEHVFEKLIAAPRVGERGSRG